VRYLGLIVIAAAVFRAVSYAGYCWEQGDRPAAAGALLMALLAAVFPVIAVLAVD